MGKPGIGRLGVIGFVVLAGCGARQAPPYPTWATPPQSVIAIPNSGNAWDEYTVIANDLRGRAMKQIQRVSFLPDQRNQAMKDCETAIQALAKASRLPCTFHYVAHPPFTPPEYAREWRLLGRVLRWKVENACAAKDFDAAIDSALLATRFGFDLTGGGVMEASLGLSIADDAREALAPSLNEMGAAQLDRLEKGMEEALQRKPPISEAVKHAGDDMMQALQFIQDAFRSKNTKVLLTQLGPDVKDAVDYLDDLEGNDEKRAKYFQDFAAEGEEQQTRLLHNAELPVAERTPPIKLETRKDRPWKRFAPHFFATAEPLLTMNDRTVARTRLLAINSEILRRNKLGSPYPETIKDILPNLNTDPYSGKSFLYRTDKARFLVYSVGEDLRDDGGDTDASFQSPDLRLEGSPTTPF